jgi:calcineurin-like phosphoesterase family protein
LVHKPEDSKGNNLFWLFAHIHAAQTVKKNGLNVGVDCHNFKPIDMEAVLFYRNAILNHYDKNVFMSELGKGE